MLSWGQGDTGSLGTVPWLGTTVHQPVTATAWGSAGTRGPHSHPPVVSHPSSSSLSSVKVMDGLCSASLGAEEALTPLWHGEPRGPQPCPAVPAVVPGFAASTKVVLLMLHPWIWSR